MCLQSPAAGQAIERLGVGSGRQGLGFRVDPKQEQLQGLGLNKPSTPVPPS